MKIVKNIFPLIAIWIILSAHFDPFFLSIGLLSSCVIAFFCRNSDVKAYFVFKFVLFYLPWLIWQVILSSLYVVKQIWKLEIDIKENNIIEVKNKQKNDLLLTIFANSITLTPGTATISLGEDKILIHCLTKDTEGGVFDIEKKLAENFN